MLGLMDWMGRGTFFLAALGAGLGVFNTVVAFRRGRPRFQVTGYVQKGDDGVRRLRIKVVNTGNVPVKIEKVFLARSWGYKPKRWQLWEHNLAKPRLPIELPKRGDDVVVVINIEAVKRPFVDQCFTVVAQSTEGRHVKGRSAGLRELAAEIQAAAAKQSTPD